MCMCSIFLKLWKLYARCVRMLQLCLRFWVRPPAQTSDVNFFSSCIVCPITDNGKFSIIRLIIYRSDKCCASRNSLCIQWVFTGKEYTFSQIKERAGRAMLVFWYSRVQDQPPYIRVFPESEWVRLIGRFTVELGSRPIGKDLSQKKV